MTTLYVYSLESINRSDVAVIWNGTESSIAITKRGGTHAVVDEAYAGDAAGLSLAIYRAHYLAGKLKNGFGKEALRIAESIAAKGPRKAHEDWLADMPKRHFICDACGYPSRNGAWECDNPGCLSNPHANHAALRARQADYEQRKCEDAARAASRARIRASGFTTAF